MARYAFSFAVEGARFTTVIVAGATELSP